jgi:sugar phosphate isomerase/epimerase
LRLTLNPEKAMDHDTNRLTRRGFLQSTAGALGLTLAGALTSCAHGTGMVGRRGRVPIGMQLYSVRHELARDLPGTLDRLAGMGFEGVEFADYFGRPAAELRGMLDQRGLQCCGTHVYMHDLEGERFAETVDFARTLGAPYLIVRWIPDERRDGRASFLQTAQWFNDVAARLEPYRIRVGYHSHDYIFRPLDGETFWDTLARNTRDDVVLQLDTGPATMMGKDVAELLRRHPGRSATMHMKAYSTAQPAAYLGADEIDWARVVEAAETVGGIEWYILEYEIEGVPPLEALEASLAYFRQLVR